MVHEKLIGSMYVTYSGVSKLSAKCSTTLCKRGSRSKATLSYTLPSWLARRMIQMWVSGGPTEGPELLLKTRRVIKHDAYYHCERGNIVALREMYVKKQATLHDVNPGSGRCSLFDDIFRERLEIVRFLLDSGADMEQADFLGFTPRDLAFQKVYGDYKLARTNLDVMLDHIFSLKDLPDDLEFTALHRIVLGLSKLDLSQELQEHADLVNVEDTLGRTALWWSTRRANFNDTSLLIKHGADPKLSSHAGRSPLHNAAASGHYDITKLLLEAGADVKMRSFEGKVSLHVVGSFNDNVGLVELFLDHGTPVNVMDYPGRTPLSLCCFNDTHHIARLLFRHGADQTLADNNGRLPWHWAVQDGAVKSLQVYIDNGCTFTQTLSNGWTVLHWAAYCANASVAAILLEADLTKVDTSAIDEEGKTARDVLYERTSVVNPAYQIDVHTEQLLAELVDR